MKKLFDAARSKLAAAGAVVGSAFVASSAFAQAGAIDVSAITTTLTAVGVAVATIGAGVLVVIFGAKAYKWIRSAG
jgi:hypothetical protein